MKTSILEMALETLKNQHIKLSEEVKQLRQQLSELKNQPQKVQSIVVQEEELDELLTIKQVQQILGVCYNTLQNNIVKKGLLVPKKLSERKIRFSKRELVEFVNSLKSTINIQPYE